MNYQKGRMFAPVVLRISLALLLLWFGITNIFSPEILVGYLSQSIRDVLPISPIQFMILNGVVEVVLGILLLIGLCTRIAAAIVALHLFGIALGIGYGDIMIRDLALAFSAVAVFLFGPDAWCRDYKK